MKFKIPSEKQRPAVNDWQTVHAHHNSKIMSTWIS